MNANYIINRLRSTPYKFPTAAILRDRLNNLDEYTKYQITDILKKEVYKERNHDIQQPLEELLFRMPIAS